MFRSPPSQLSLIKEPKTQPDPFRPVSRVSYETHRESKTYNMDKLYVSSIEDKLNGIPGKVRPKSALHPKTRTNLGTHVRHMTQKSPHRSGGSVVMVG